MRVTTFRVLDQIRATFARALEQAPTDEPELIETLTEGLAQVDVALFDLVTQEEEIAAATDRLLAHVSEDAEAPAASPVPVPLVEPFDLNAEIRALFLPPSQMSVVA